MNCYIVCNMFPALVSDVVRAPGLRAEQLFNQAKGVFSNVNYIMPRTRYNLLTRNNFSGMMYRPHPKFSVLHDDYIETFLDRIDQSVFVFTQLEFSGLFQQVRAAGHLVVYDILAPKILELECGGKPQKEIDRMAHRHGQFSTAADLVMVNGKKNHGLFAGDIPEETPMETNPFCPLTPLVTSGSRDGIMFYASSQKWTNNAPFLKTMADYLEQNPDQPAYFLASKKAHEDPESPSYSRLLQLPNVRQFTSLSYPVMTAILGKCHAALDWSVFNDEREYSTSTRLIQAVGAGCAIFGNAETGLDHYWNGYPGETSAAPPSLEEITDFLAASRAGEYAPKLTGAAEWNRRHQSSHDAFNPFGDM